MIFAKEERWHRGKGVRLCVEMQTPLRELVESLEPILRSHPLAKVELEHDDGAHGGFNTYYIDIGWP